MAAEHGYSEIGTIVELSGICPRLCRSRDQLIRTLARMPRHHGDRRSPAPDAVLEGGERSPRAGWGSTRLGEPDKDR